MCQCIIECGLLTGTRSAEGIMASGHANRANRPNTWLHRPATRREVLTCQPGAVHTWHLADQIHLRYNVCYWTQSGRPGLKNALATPRAMQLSHAGPESATPDSYPGCP